MSGEIISADYDHETEAQVASFILEEWNKHKAYRHGVEELWQEVEAYFYATDTKNSKMGQSAFDHSVHVPVLATIGQDLQAILSQVTRPHEDWFDFEPEEKKAALKGVKQKVLAYLKNRHRVDKFESKVATHFDLDLILYGNVFARTDFVNEQRDEDDKVGYVGPRTQRISPYDIVFDVTAASFEHTPLIIRHLFSTGKIAEMVASGQLNERAEEVLLKRRGENYNKMSHHEKNQSYVPAGFSSFDAYITSGVVEVLEFLGDIYEPESGTLEYSRRILSVDGEFIIFDDHIDTPTGKPRIRHAGWQKRPDNLMAMGPLENIVGLNHQINHRENAKNDALDKTIYSDKVMMGDVEEIYDDETGQTVYLAPEGGGVQELTINTQFFQNDLEVDRNTAYARQAARLPLDLVGFRSPGEKTFGEVSALTEGAMRGFLHKARDYERFFESILTDQLSVASQHVSAVVQVPGQRNEMGGIPFLEIARGDLEVAGSLKARGAQRFQRKNQILSTVSQLAQSGLIDRASPHTSGKALAELIAELTELEGTGVFKEFAQVTEGAELMQKQQQAEQVVAGAVQQPTLQESLIEQELGE